MRRAERLFRLVQEMRRLGTCRAEDLARGLEVSKRTVYRDIAHLQASGLPIDGEAGVGYVLRPGFDLPSVTFTHDQLDALAVGLALAQSMDDPGLAAAAEVRAKLQAGLPQPEARRLADAPYFALRRSTGAPRHAASLRPLAIWSLAEGWMVSGWCELRSDFRTFRLDRIQILTVLNETHPDEPGRDLAAFLARDACETHSA